MSHFQHKIIFSSLPFIVAIIIALLLTIPGIPALFLFMHFLFLLAPIFERKPLHSSLLVILIITTLGVIFNDAIAKFLLSTIQATTLYDQAGKIFFQSFILNDAVLIITALALTISCVQLSFLKKLYFRKCPNTTFEKRYMQVNNIQKNLAHYLTTFSLGALVAVPLWSAAAYFLEFESIAGIAVVAGFAAALPFWGMILVAAYLLFFMSKSVIFLQVGGLLILLSVNWFINYLLNIHTPLNRANHLHVLILFVVCFALSIPEHAIFVMPIVIMSNILLKSIRLTNR